MAGRVPAIHTHRRTRIEHNRSDALRYSPQGLSLWITGTSPVMTIVGYLNLTGQPWRKLHPDEAYVA